MPTLTTPLCSRSARRPSVLGRTDPFCDGHARRLPRAPQRRGGFLSSLCVVDVATVPCLLATWRVVKPLENLGNQPGKYSPVQDKTPMRCSLNIAEVGRQREAPVTAFRPILVRGARHDQARR